jgi:hypothetical protein
VTIRTQTSTNTAKPAHAAQMVNRIQHIALSHAASQFRANLRQMNRSLLGYSPAKPHTDISAFI